MKRDSTLPLWDNLPVSLQVRRRTVTVPYSREKLYRSLLPCDIAPDYAVKAVKMTEQKIAQEGKSVISTARIRALVTGFLSASAGEEAADSYQVWRNFEKESRPFVLLLCGAPGVGKAALASAVSWKLGIDRIVDFDYLSCVLHRNGLLRSGRIFNLFFDNLLPVSGGFKYLRKNGDIVREFAALGRQLEEETYAAIRSAVEQRTHATLFGSALMPWTLDLRQFSPRAVVFPVTAALPEKASLRKGAAEPGYEVSDAFRIIHHYINTQSVRHKIPVIHPVSFDHAVAHLLQLCTRYIKVRLGRAGLLEDALDNLRLILDRVHA